MTQCICLEARYAASVPQTGAPAADTWARESAGGWVSESQGGQGWSLLRGVFLAGRQRLLTCPYVTFLLFVSALGGSLFLCFMTSFNFNDFLKHGLQIHLLTRGTQCEKYKVGIVQTSWSGSLMPRQTGHFLHVARGRCCNMACNIVNLS